MTKAKIVHKEVFKRTYFEIRKHAYDDKFAWRVWVKAGNEMIPIGSFQGSESFDYALGSAKLAVRSYLAGVRRDLQHEVRLIEKVRGEEKRLRKLRGEHVKALA